ncbi:MAG: NAD-dependent DNA ligase LigA [Elusimicrobiota bacterium]
MTYSIKTQIEDLRQELRKHDYLYYVKAEPVIGDEEYDRKYRQLKELEKRYPQYDSPDSPTKRVGGDIQEEFRTVSHKTPMLSLDKVYSQDELKKWQERILKSSAIKSGYVVEEKIDGVGVSLSYNKGVLDLALSRGNGFEGDDITQNIRTQRIIPLKLKTDNPPEFIEIRGEMFLSLSEFRRINRDREKKSLPVFSNPRNTCSGTLKLLDPSKVSKRRMNAFFYSVGAWQGSGKVSTQQELLHVLSEWGLPVNHSYRKCSDLKEIFNVYNELSSKRHKRNYEVDGVVVKVNSFREQEKLGTTSKSPRWAVAYKYEAKKALTKIEDVKFGVGRTGQVTPVAKLKPVKLAGVIISNATLHNFDFVKAIDAGVGDIVEIERGGDVIPKILGVSKKMPNRKTIIPPKKCPSCDSLLKKDPEGAYLRCVSISCPAQLKQRIVHYASTGAMNIEGLGEKVAGQLVENGIVKNLQDIYNLNAEKLLSLNLFAEKKAENLLRHIEESKECRLENFIWALGIRHVGRHIASVLADKFRNISSLSAADREELESISEVGPVVAENIVNFFSDPRNKKTIESLLQSGVNPGYDEAETELSGKNFVFTGSLNNLKRSEAENIVERYGGRASSSVSSKTDYLVKGENPGSKLKKAGELGVEIISEDDFKKVIKNLSHE